MSTTSHADQPWVLHEDVRMNDSLSWLRPAGLMLCLKFQLRGPIGAFHLENYYGQKQSTSHSSARG